MRKYLMTGVAAIAFCAAFTSCSKSGDELYNPEQIKQNEIAQVYDNYNRAFVATFGQPAANQDWGFGAGTRGFNANANEWADPAKNDDGKAWNVVDELSQGQKNRVRAYFQNVRQPQGISINYTNFFVQQVYKGNTKAKTSTSKEQYQAANGSWYDAQQMNYFMANGEHVHDFNNGDRSEKDVLDNGQTVNGGTTHKDKISLMVGSSTANFGFQQSGSSYYHHDRYVIISWSTIDEWASQNPSLLDAVDEPIGEKWNRSFVGLDFDTLPLSECESNSNFKVSDWETVSWVKNADGTFSAFDSTQDYIYDGKTVGKLITETNLYSAEDKVTLQDGQMFVEYRDANNNNALIGKALNKAYLDGYISQGYRPTSSNFREWIKVGSCRDYYYSDWIVCVTEGLKVDGPTPPPSNDWDIRVIAEDLNAKAQNSPAPADGLEESDWDFNDVVFDVKFTSETTAKVKIVCAGGVLPLFVDGHEVHQVLGQSAPGADGLYSIIGMSDAAEPFTVTGINKSQKAKDIKVTVMKTLSDGGTELFELTAPQGKPAAKIGVNPKFEPCGEREDIRQKYRLFSDWVQGNITGAWYTIPE